MSWFPYDTQTRRRLSDGLNASEATVNRYLFNDIFILIVVDIIRKVYESIC